MSILPNRSMTPARRSIDTAMPIRPRPLDALNEASLASAMKPPMAARIAEIARTPWTACPRGRRPTFSMANAITRSAAAIPRSCLDVSFFRFPKSAVSRKPTITDKTTANAPRPLTRSSQRRVPIILTAWAIRMSAPPRTINPRAVFASFSLAGMSLTVFTMPQRTDRIAKSPLARFHGSISPSF